MDIKTLRYGTWLNDKIINFYMKLLYQRNKEYKTWYETFKVISNAGLEDSSPNDAGLEKHAGEPTISYLLLL